MSYFLCVIGMVMIVEGMPYFVIPGKMKDILRKVLSMEENYIRQFGLLLMLTGLVLVFVGKKY